MDCDFDAAGSSDSDGVITNYQWDFGDGSGVSGPASVVSHSYAVEGEYTVLLTVTDDDGAQASSSETVTVAPPPPENQAPVADFTHACVDLVCSFDASASHDPDGSIVEYSWGFGDGGSTQSASHLTEHTYLASGDYLVTLEVQDNLGATGTVMLSVFVPPEESEQGIELSVTGQKTRGRKSASLSWSGAESSEVDVLRDGAVLVTTANDGAYVDSSIPKNGKTFRYTVCETGTLFCSDEVTIRF
jgi:PKD repeat protein